METKNFYQQIGRCIRDIRKEKMITQEELGKQLGLTKSAIVNYETGSRKIPLDTVAKLSLYYNFSLDCLIKKQKTLSDILNSEIGNKQLTDQQEQLLINYIKILLGSEK